MINDKNNLFKEKEAVEKGGAVVAVEKTFYKKKRSVLERILLVFIFLALCPLAIFSIMLIVAYQDAIILYAPPENLALLQRNLFFLIMLIIVLVIVLMVFAAIWISRTFTMPLNYLIEATKKIANEDFDFKLKIISDDEFGELAGFFNLMIIKLRDYRDREKTISAMKSEFISVAAHQLRTPLSAIKWTLRLIIDGDIGELTSEQKLFLQKGYDSNERMIHLVGDLLNSARIEEGRFGYTFVITDIVKVIEEIIEQLSIKAKERDVLIVLEKPENKVLNIKIDPSRINLAIGNLIDNAIKYNLPKGTVTVSLKEEIDYLKISIADKGVGIPKKSLDRLFTKFFRAENVVKLQTEGTGLGLFIVKNIIESHGGKIWAESEENKGTTFYVLLPLKESLIPEKEKSMVDIHK